MTQPGLDPRTLQGLRAGRDLDPIRTRIAHHLVDHQGYLAFSGGKDSLVVLDITRQVAPEIPVVFFDSGLEFPETYTYLDQLADRWRLNLTVIPARVSALHVLAASGAWDHHAPAAPVPNLHHALITEPAGRAHNQFGPGELWGVRAQESRGRAAAYANALRAASCTCPARCPPQEFRAQHGGQIARTDHTVAYGPVWDWRTAEIWGHISRHQLPVNPVYAKLARLGAPEHALRVSTMIEANRLEVGRITWLCRGWPTLFNELATLIPRLREYV